MPGQGKGTMADVQRSLSGGHGMRPAGLVRRSMPAPVEPQHSIAALPVEAENLLQMPIRMTRDAQPVARKRLVLPRHSSSPARPARELTLDAVRGRLVVAASTIPLLGEHGVWTGVSTNVNAVAMAPPETIHVARFFGSSSTFATHMTEASTNRVQVLPALEQMGPIESVPLHSMPNIVAIAFGGAQPSILTEYTQDADGYW